MDIALKWSSVCIENKKAKLTYKSYKNSNFEKYKKETRKKKLKTTHIIILILVKIFNFYTVEDRWIFEVRLFVFFNVLRVLSCLCSLNGGGGIPFVRV